MASNKEYAVNWKNHMSHMKEAFESLFDNNEFVDVTLYCEGQRIGAHKMVLSACSPYFRNIFKDVPCQHHVIVLNNVEFSIMENLIHFIYHGEVSVHTSKLNLFLRTAQTLKISGLMDAKCLKESPEDPAAVAEPAEKRKRDSNSSSDVQQAPKLPRPDPAPAEPEDIALMDVKCEPNELVDIFEPLEDPLRQDATTHSYLQESQDLTEEEELKFDPAYVLEPAVPEFATNNASETIKPKHSNFSEDCLRCPICQKIFSHPYSLHHHKAVHSGNTECPICHVVLSRKYNLKMHMKARHNI